MDTYISKVTDAPAATGINQPQSQPANSEFKALMREFSPPENTPSESIVEKNPSLSLPPVTTEDTVESIKHRTQDNLSWQAYYHSGGHFKLGEKFRVPKVLPSYAEAARAIGPGGPYSVEAVSSCVLSLAAQVAQESPEKIAEIRHEIQKAVAAFRMAYKALTKEKDLPQICLDTYDAIMSGLDKLQAEYTEQNTATEKSA